MSTGATLNLQALFGLVKKHGGGESLEIGLD